MRNRATLALIINFLFFHDHTLFAQYEWRHRACPPAYQGGAVSFAVGSKAYVVGGDTAPPSPSGISALVSEYDPATDVWTRKNNFPYSANNPACFVINDTAYVGIGLDNSLTYHSDFYRYDQAHDQWIRIADFPGLPRYGAMTFSLHGLGYLGCGHGGTVYSDFYAYDPVSDSWTQKANLPGAARQSGIGGAAGNRGYIGLGSGSSFYGDIYQYNDTLDSWRTINSFTATGRNSVGSFILNDTLYAVGGRDASMFYHDCWSYSVSNNTWTSRADFSCLSSDSVFIQDGFTINGHSYLRPLENSTPLHILLEYGSRDESFAQHIQALGSDTLYNVSTISRVLSVPDSCALWSTGVTGSSITVSMFGTYWARWNVPCGIARDTIVLSSTKTGLENISADDPVEIYPIPTRGSLHLEVIDYVIGSTYEIIDISGRPVYKDQIKDAHTILNPDIENGMYSLKITTSNRTYLKRFVKL